MKACHRCRITGAGEGCDICGGRLESALDIELPTMVRCGEELRGQILCWFGEPEVSIRLEHLAIGEQDSTNERNVLYKGTLSLDKGRAEFTIPLPYAALPYEGSLVQIRWLLTATAGKATVTRRVQVKPGPPVPVKKAYALFKRQLYIARVVELLTLVGYSLLTALFFIIGAVSGIHLLVKMGKHLNVLELVLCVGCGIWTVIISYFFVWPRIRKLLASWLPVQLDNPWARCGNTLRIPDQRGLAWRLVIAESSATRIVTKTEHGHVTRYKWKERLHEMQKGRGEAQISIPANGPSHYWGRFRRVRWELRYSQPHRPGFEYVLPMLVLGELEEGAFE